MERTDKLPFKHSGSGTTFILKSLIILVQMDTCYTNLTMSTLSVFGCTGLYFASGQDHP